MCGICGIISKQGSLNPDVVRSMNDAIAHRGPDDEGYLLYNSVSKDIKEISKDFSLTGNSYNLHLGHRRLSILDITEHGHQPFCDSGRKYFLNFNGEIYNYIELREDLVKKGYRFVSNTDTEVLLYLYMEYKEKCLDMLNGMWSFVILDVEKNILFGSRDRFGVKPFYYYWSNEYFIFSSEIKSLIKAPQISREINKEAAFDFLTNGRILDDYSTLFKNIFELETSSYFILDLNSYTFKKSKYYSLDFNRKKEKFNERKSIEYIESIREKIFDAVNIRLRSDVKVGSCLSGGVDSSAIVCVINSLLKRKKIEQVGDLQKVFTSVFPDTEIDESKWAALVADSTMSEWFKTYPSSNELLDDIEKLIYVQDVPFGSTSIYSQFRVMKLASENGVKVLLDGQGGDELFTGYKYFLRPFYNEMIKERHIKAIINEYGKIGNSPITRFELLETLGLSIAKLFVPADLKRKLFGMKFRESNLLNEKFYKANQKRLDLGKIIEYTNLNEALYEQFTRTSLKELLKYEDCNSMNFSIEARTPFADDIDLIEYVFDIPSTYKIHDGWTKYLLRESMKGIIPEPIRKRTDKLGFATPEYIWLNNIKNKVRDYFTPDLNEYLNTVKILNDWDSIFSSQTKTGITNFWRFINFAVWKKVYEL